jgi:hypothetical protein
VDDDVPEGSVGTVPLDAPVPRADVERAVRSLAFGVESVRDDVLQLAAQVIALTEELGRQAAVDARAPAIVEQLRGAEERGAGRIALGDAEDKYAEPSQGPDCRALLPVCQGRCCTLHFALSSQDLDEGVIRWDYGRPYLIRQRIDDGYCVHNHPEGHYCTVYEHRPRPCRQYDCRKDQRIWKDFERRELADFTPYARKEDGGSTPPLDLAERVRRRQMNLAMESFSLGTHEAARKRYEDAELAKLRGK